MAEITPVIDLSHLNNEELMRAEREIAHRHLNKFPYLIVFWGLANTAVWLSLFPLVMMDIVPLWAGFIIATANIMLSYLPSHDAQHDIIARPGQKLRWLNEFVGHWSLIPLVLPFRIARATHMEHHKHANNPDLDPDYGTHAPNARAALINSIVTRQPGSEGGLKSYGDVMVRLGLEKQLLDGLIANLTFYGTLTAMAWTGFALEAALLWWLPRHIAFTYIIFYLSWAPHHPAETTGRYKDTRGWRSRFGNIGSMGMQYHIIHHLHPRIPLNRTPRAYWEMRDILIARDCKIDNL